MINITDIRVRLVEKGGNLKAVASMTLDNCFVVHDIKILENHGQMMIGMPSKKVETSLPETGYMDIVHAINTETRDFIKAKVLSSYEKKVKGD